MAMALPTGIFAQSALRRFADWLMIAIAVSLPWSTSATSILGFVWFLVLVAALGLSDLKRVAMTAAGGLPILLFLFGVAGMLWANVDWVERWNGLESFFKLLAIPLLFVQFRQSQRGIQVFIAYLVACVALLILSTVISLWPGLWWPGAHFGVPVKNAPTQSGEFVTCIAVLFYAAVEKFQAKRREIAAAAILLIVWMGANMFYIALSRTALVSLLILIVIWGVKQFGTKGRVVVVVSLAAICAGVWATSPYFRARTIQLWTDYVKYEATNDQNSSGERIEFWKKSVEFLREAPLFGHGTGSIHGLFIKSSEGKTGAASSATTNPHNQTFAVGIQLGIFGVLVLWAMWIAHFWLFRGGGLVNWIGLVVVIQNIIGSLFNSHLFDFTQGWVYVIGVGVAGGMVRKQQMPNQPTGVRV